MTANADEEVRRDSPLSGTALFFMLVYTGFFIVIGAGDPKAWRISLYYIAAIVPISAALVVYGQVFPYSRAAQNFKRSEFARLKATWEENTNTLTVLDPRAFEDAVARLFRQLGYAVQQTPYSADEGRDAIATKAGRTFLIEMKRYSPDKPVGRPILMKLHSAMVSAKADGGILVTTSGFTRPAVEFAKANRIRLIDRDNLGLLLGEAYPNPGNPNLIRALCRRCGSKVGFDLNDEGNSRNCPNGHAVEHPIATRTGQAGHVSNREHESK